MADQAPRSKELAVTIPAASAGTAQDTIVGEAPFDGEVTSVEFIPESAITGATATKRTMTLTNSDNSDTVAATLDFTTGVDAVENDAKAFTLSAVDGATDVEEGDVLVLTETIASTGTANPGGLLKVVVAVVND